MSDSRRSVHSAGPSLDLVVAGLLVSFPLSVIDFLINVLKDCRFEVSGLAYGVSLCCVASISGDGFRKF